MRLFGEEDNKTMKDTTRPINASPAACSAVPGAGLGLPPAPVVRLGRLLAALALLLTGLALHGAAAEALSQRGHEFEGSFGASGQSVLAPGADAIAINEASGDIYVVDKADNRVERFGAHYEFIEAWGWGVNEGGEQFEKCSEEARCKPAIGGVGVGQFDSPTAIAIDNAPGSASAGDVYVVANRSWRKAVVDKFSPDGQLLGTLISKKEEKEEVEGAIDGVAVDQSGDVWVEREEEEDEVQLLRFNDQTSNRLLESTEAEVPSLNEVARPTRPGFAVDSLGDVFITYEPGGTDLPEELEEIEEREEARKENKEELKHEGPGEPCQQNRCLVAELHLSQSSGELEAQPLISELDSENSSGVASDASLGAQASGDVYLDNRSSVAAFDPGGVLIQRFGQAQLSQGAGASGMALDVKGGELLLAQEAPGSEGHLSDQIEVYRPSAPGPPTIESQSVSTAQVSSSSATVRASIDPSGSETYYRVRYGSGRCEEAPTPSCEQEAPAPPGIDLGGGFGSQSAAVALSGLSPQTTYHLRVIAEDRGEGSSGASVLSEEASFTTLAAGEAPSTLPDGRAYELVSPADKRGVAIEGIAHEGGLIQAASEGQALTYLAAAPAGEEEPAGNRAPEPAQLISTRGEPGQWSTQNITTPNHAAQGIKAEARREYEFFSEDLALAVVFPAEPLFGEGGREAIYRRSACSEACGSAPCTQSSCFQALVSASSTGLSAGLELMGATPDLSHAVIKAAEPPPGAAGEGLGLYESSDAGPGAGQLTLISVLPDGQQATGQVGLGTLQLYEGPRNALSEDGSRTVWKAGTPSEAHLYDSQLVGEGVSTEVKSVQIDTPQEGVDPAAHAEPVFMDASADGQKVFFTDDQRLTSDASQESETSGDLYVFEADRPAGQRLTDLTPDINAGESAAVQGGVIGVSSDGSYVYLVANGVLSAGAQPGECQWGGLRGASCNLYVIHQSEGHWQSPRFIASLSNEDGPDWGTVAPSREEYSLVEMTSRVSPDGHYLAFMSDRRLPTQGRPSGYDNSDEKSGAPDEEVYLYDALSGALICASCNPSGARPVGVYDTLESGEGLGLLVDRPAIWSSENEEAGFDHWLSGSLPGWTGTDNHEAFYQSRYLSDQGRLFFNSDDSLSRQDVNGKEDVYEYEPAGLGSCQGAQQNTEEGCVALISSGKSEQESAFGDASQSGNDVFFLTSAKLSPQDPDSAYDIYDARVCEGPEATAPCPPPASSSSASCQSEASCKGQPSQPPSIGAPASATPSGQGNIAAQGVLGQKAKAKAKPLTRKQKLAAALKACKKHKQKKQRTACEKRAKKRYGPLEKTKKSGSANTGNSAPKKSGRRS